MRVTSKGQVTIPIQIRERVGLLPHTEVEFEVVADWVRLRKVSASRRRGLGFVQRMRGRADRSLSTDEIMALTRRDGA